MLSFRWGVDRISAMVRDAHVKSPSRTRRPKRSVRQRIFRAGVFVFASLAVLYATLPWWTPKQYLAGKIARDLSDMLSVPVSISSLKMSWSEGVTISDVRIGNGAGFGDADMVVADTLRCDLSPLRMLWSGQLKWIELTGVRLDVVLDKDGHANIAALGPLVEMPPPDWMAFRRTAVTVQFPDHDRLLRLDVSDLQYRVGELENVGRLTMSAELSQKGQSAPMTLTASAARPSSPKSGETYEGSSAASASFRFAGVDISQLNLPKLLSLPLKRFSGCASGQMDCRFDRTGRVGRFSLELCVKDLDAQPAVGPSIPVIEKADLTLTATSDPIYESIDVSTFGLHLPGIELKGKGRIHADALSGRWEAVRSLEITAKVNPTTVATLLSGRSPTLPGGMEFDGNVDVNISLRGDKSQMSFSLALDATTATIRCGRRVAKPAGRKLTAEIHGNVEKHTWRLWTDPSRPAEMRIGRNRFSGTGSLWNVRHAPEGMDWQGRWKIVELDSIGDLLAGFSAGKYTIPPEVRMDGEIAGQWFIENDRVGLRSVRLPKGTRLSIGEWFVKPADQSIEMELSSTVTSDPPGIDNVRFRVGLSRLSRAKSRGAKSRGTEQVGESGWDVNIEDGRLAFNGGIESGCIRTGARYSVRGIGELLACIPAVDEWKKRIGGPALRRLDGSLTGKADVMLSPSMRRLRIGVNVTQVKADVGRSFRKVAGQPAEVTLDFRSDDTLGPDLQNRITVRVELASAVLDGSLTFPSVKTDSSIVRCSGHIRVPDTAWLLQSVCTDALLRRLGPLGIRGSMVASLQARMSAETVAGELFCNADDLQFNFPGSDSESLSNVKRLKPRGSALRLRLAGEIDEKTATINILSLDVGKSNVSVTGKVCFSAEPKFPPMGTYWPVPGVEGVDLNVGARLVPDLTAETLIPELAKLAERYGLDGAVRFAGKIQADEKAINAAGEFDATDLGIAFLDKKASRKHPSGRKPRNVEKRIARTIKYVTSRFSKPRGKRATAKINLTIPADFSEIKVRDVFVDTDFFQLRADATLPMLERKRGQEPFFFSVHAALSVLELHRLVGLFPRLARYRPAGGVFIEGLYTHNGGEGVLDYVTLQAGNASATVNKKRCRVDGTVTLEKVMPDGPDLRIGRIATDSFEFAVGVNHGFIVADLRDPTHNPSGKATLLCTRLDTFDLERWVADEAVPPIEKPLNTKTLARRADKVIAYLRGLLSEADLRCRVQIEQLRYFDPKVRAFFEPRGMIADVHVEKGNVRAGYRCGLNGGIMENIYSLDLAAADARVALKSDLTELLVDKNLLAQIAQEFPGNTIYGTFSQAKEVTYSLRDLVMNSLDVRYNPIPVGTAKTVATEGMVRGKGAPKWMTHIFPGLNLTKYRYRKMTGFAEYLPDGTAENDMIFNGSYDIYMVGNTDVKGIARYTIGVILLSAPQSPEFNHRLRQGRVPMLKFQARIKDGRFYDEEVSYPWPTETAYRIFLANNLFYRLWLDAKNKPVAAETNNKPEK